LDRTNSTGETKVHLDTPLEEAVDFYCQTNTHSHIKSC